MAIRKGSTLILEKAPGVVSFGAVGSKKESEGPLAEGFDQLFPDSTLGESTWEKAECRLQKEAIRIALEKGGLKGEDLHFLFAGDLLNQCISSTFGLLDYQIPFLGQYGACSTMAQTLFMASVMVESGAAERAGHGLRPPPAR